MLIHYLLQTDLIYEKCLPFCLAFCDIYPESLRCLSIGEVSRFLGWTILGSLSTILVTKVRFWGEILRISFHPIISVFQKIVMSFCVILREGRLFPLFKLAPHLFLINVHFLLLLPLLVLLIVSFLLLLPAPLINVKQVFFWQIEALLTRLHSFICLLNLLKLAVISSFGHIRMVHFNQGKVQLFEVTFAVPVQPQLWTHFLVFLPQHHFSFSECNLSHWNL